MKKHLFFFTVAALLSTAAMFPSRASAQFVNNSLYLGPELGLGLGYGGGIMLGGMVEEPITNPGTVGPGLLAIAARIDYWSWSVPDFSLSYIPIGVLCNYHFVLSDTKWDPFLGLGLGYVIVNSSWTGEGQAFNYSSGSTVFITGEVGARYFISPAMAIRAEFGFSYLPFAVGLDFKL
jgi:hypothetical protein